MTSIQPTTNINAATYRWILAWLVMIVLLSILNKTRMGHVLIYWSLVLTLFFLLVTQYRFIAAALAPLGTKVPQAAAPAPAPGFIDPTPANL